MRNVEHIGIVTRSETPSGFFCQTMAYANLVLSCGHKIPNQTSFENIYAGDAVGVGFFVLGDLRVLWGGTDHQMGHALRTLRSALLNTVVVGNYGDTTKKAAKHLIRRSSWKNVHWFDPADQGVPDYVRLIRNNAGVLLIQSIVEDNTMGPVWRTWEGQQPEPTKPAVQPVEEAAVVIPTPVAAPVPKPKRKYTRRKATKDA